AGEPRGVAARGAAGERRLRVHGAPRGHEDGVRGGGQPGVGNGGGQRGSRSAAVGRAGGARHRAVREAAAPRGLPETALPGAGGPERGRPRARGPGRLRRSPQGGTTLARERRERVAYRTASDAAWADSHSDMRAVTSSSIFWRSLTAWSAAVRSS